MITITYHKQYHALTMEGHAYTDEPGKDLVCASASMLAYTLAANARALEAQGALRDMHAELNAGKADIRCTPVRKMKSVVQLVFETVCIGFDLLARDYPEQVRFEILG